MNPWDHTIRKTCHIVQVESAGSRIVRLQGDGPPERRRAVFSLIGVPIGIKKVGRGLPGLTSFLLLWEACKRMHSPLPHASIYHVAGLDERARGFNRQVHVIPCEGGFLARFRYELLQIEVDPVPIEEQVLQGLIHLLHEKGYTQLRTQRIFIGDQYLGNQEVWVDYPDPESPLDTKKTWLAWLRQVFNPSSHL